MRRRWRGRSHSAAGTQEELDSVSSDIPILIVHLSGHLATVDSTMLRAIGMDTYSRDPAGGTPMDSHDLFISVLARSRGIGLLTRNLREFQRVPGLTVEDGRSDQAGASQAQQEKRRAATRDDRETP